MALQNDRPETRIWPSILSRRDWVYLLSLLIPFVVFDLSLKALLVLSQPGVSGLVGRLALMQSDLLFNLGYVLLWVALFALARKGLFRWIVVGLFHVITLLITLITTAAYQYFKATGSTLDSHYVSFWFSSPEATGGPIAAEVPASIALLVPVILVYTLLGPPLVSRLINRWRGWSDTGARGPKILWLHRLRPLGTLLAACVLFWLSLAPGGASAGASKSFSRDAFVHLMLTAVEVAQGDDLLVVAASPPADGQPSTAAPDETPTVTGGLTGGSQPSSAAPDKEPPVVTEGSPASEVSLLPTGSTERRNVVLIFLESTRPSATTPYNPELQTTPFMDELAKSSLLAEKAYTVVPHTHNALAATNCGVDPPFDPRSTVKMAEPGSVPETCLPHLLKAQGYSSVFFMSHVKGFEDSQGILTSLGYEEFYSLEHMETEGFEQTYYWGYEDEIMLEPSREWLQANGDKPFLVSYLTSAPHHDYRAPQKRYGRVKFSDRDVLNRYLNAVRNQDFFLKKLFDQYKRLGLYENTVFIILGDHGEGFGEHGRFGHDNVIYEEGLGIPLLIHDPSRFENGKRVEGPVDQLDILPTVTDLLGYKIQGGAYRGVSLLQPLPTDRTLMFSCLGEKECLASLKGTSKYIYHFDDRPDQLFDLATDPEERNNLAAQSPPEELNKRRAELLRWRREVRSRYPSR